MCDINVNQQSKPNKKNKVLTSLCKRKQIMVCFMAFSCKTGSINRCLGAGRLGSCSGRLLWASGLVVASAQDHLSKNVFGFQLPLFNLLPFSITVASVDVSPTIDSYEPLDNRELRRRIVQELGEVNPVMQNAVRHPAVRWRGGEIRTKGGTQVILAHLHSQPANEDQGDVRMMIGFEIIQAEA